MQLDFIPKRTRGESKVIGDGYLLYWPEKDGRPGQFSCEISEMRDHVVSTESGINILENMTIKNVENEKVITFQFTHRDMDGSNEDIYGWNYKAIHGNTKPCTLLIIND